MCKERNKYRKTCRANKIKYNRQQAHYLTGLRKGEPKLFWKEINKHKKRESLPQLNYYDHFKKLSELTPVNENESRNCENNNSMDLIRNEFWIDQ